MATITVYTSPNCQPCRFTKRRLEARGLAFEEVALADHPEIAKELKNEGFSSSPVVKTPSASWSGLRVDLIDALPLED